MAEDKEAGWKWWLRHVIVPLIGSGGIIALFISFWEHPRIGKSETEPPVIQRQESKFEQTPTPIPAPITKPVSTPVSNGNAVSAAEDENPNHLESDLWVKVEGLGVDRSDFETNARSVTVGWDVKGNAEGFTIGNTEKDGYGGESEPVGRSGTKTEHLRVGINRLTLFEQYDGLMLRHLKSITITVAKPASLPRVDGINFYLQKSNGELIREAGVVQNGSRLDASWDIKNLDGKLYYGCASEPYFVPNENLRVPAKSEERSSMDCYNKGSCTLYCSLLEVTKYGLMRNLKSIKVDINP